MANKRGTENRGGSSLKRMGGPGERTIKRRLKELRARPAESKTSRTAKRKGDSRAAYGSAYSRGILNQIKAAGLKIKGATSVSHIYPRAYCVAKPAPMCAVFLTPWIDAEPQIRKPEYSSSHTVACGVEKVRVGDWCAIAYVTTPGCGTLWVVDMPNSEIRQAGPEAHDKQKQRNPALPASNG